RLAALRRALTRCTVPQVSFHRAIFVRDYTRVGCDARWSGAVRCDLISLGDDLLTLFVRGLNRDDLSSNSVLLVREVGCPIFILPRDRAIFVRDYTRVGCDARWCGTVACGLITIGGALLIR